MHQAIHGPVARGFIPVGLRSSPLGRSLNLPHATGLPGLGPLRAPAGINPLATGGSLCSLIFLFVFRFFASRLAPTFSPQRTQPLCPTQTLCGSELARDEASKPNIHVTEPPPSRASSLPHWIFSRHNTHIRRKHLVGAGLLAKRPVHSTSSLAVMPPSRASPLPQGNRSTTGRARSAVRPPREQALLPQIWRVYDWVSQVGYQAASWWGGR